MHLGRGVFEIFGPAYEPVLRGAAVLLIEWLILWWMYRRKIFLSIGGSPSISMFLRRSRAPPPNNRIRKRTGKTVTTIGSTIVVLP